MMKPEICVMLVSKEDGKAPFCVGYKECSLMTKSSTHPLPELAECVELFSEVIVFSAMGSNKWSWQIKISDVSLARTVGL